MRRPKDRAGHVLAVDASPMERQDATKTGFRGKRRRQAVGPFVFRAAARHAGGPDLAGVPIVGDAEHKILVHEDHPNSLK